MYDLWTGISSTISSDAFSCCSSLKHQNNALFENHTYYWSINLLCSCLAWDLIWRGSVQMIKCFHGLVCKSAVCLCTDDTTWPVAGVWRGEVLVVLWLTLIIAWDEFECWFTSQYMQFYLTIYRQVLMTVIPKRVSHESLSWWNLFGLEGFMALFCSLSFSIPSVAGGLTIIFTSALSAKILCFLSIWTEYIKLCCTVNNDLYFLPP